MKIPITTPQFKKALLLITTLFFMWGLSYGLVDVLNKHFQEILHINKAQSGYIQAAYFGAYFCAAIPASLFTNRYGYKAGIIFGLCLYATGAFLTIPSAQFENFYFFLFAFFILALGLGNLETAANPYSIALGPKESAATRINLSQCFNGVGAFLGPIIGGYMFFSTDNSTSNIITGLWAVKITYVIIGFVVLALAFCIWKISLPDIREKDEHNHNSVQKTSIWEHKEFIFGVITNFFYIAAQVGLAALFINLIVECLPNSTSQNGAYLLSFALFCFLVGRFIGTFLMTKILPEKLVMIYGLCSAILCFIVSRGISYLSAYALIACFFFMSIMFPTIFELGIRHLGTKTKLGSACMVMSISGGAMMPFCMGYIADLYGNAAIAFLLPTICFVITTLYGFFYKKLKHIQIPKSDLIIPDNIS